MARVQTGCSDCKRCTNSAIGEGARKTGRATAAVMTLGITELGRTLTRNCRGCSHPMSLHDRGDNNLFKRASGERGAPVVMAQPTPQTTTPAWGHQPSPAPPLQATDPQDITGLIRELDELRAQGIITDAEFEAKKSDLLARL
jgi:hypothetical protein